MYVGIASAAAEEEILLRVIRSKILVVKKLRANDCGVLRAEIKGEDHDLRAMPASRC
jgi:hypothetical protein